MMERGNHFGQSTTIITEHQFAKFPTLNYCITLELAIIIKDEL